VFSESETHGSLHGGIPQHPQTVSKRSRLGDAILQIPRQLVQISAYASFSELARGAAQHQTPLVGQPIMYSQSPPDAIIFLCGSASSTAQISP